MIKEALETANGGQVVMTFYHDVAKCTNNFFDRKQIQI